MKERINWIDWAKALAALSIIFAHLPQSQEWVYFRFVQACTITVFFFLSGYLKKDRGSTKANWKKYWNSLLVPYLVYNAIVYPYWLFRHAMLYGGLPDLATAMRPVIGTLLLQHENSFAEPLDGPLWYLPAILIMHVMVDLSHKTRYFHQIMTGLCILSYFLYAANIEWQFMHSLTPMGIFRRLPYYYIGYVMGRQGLFQDVRPKRDALACICLMAASVLFFYWHLHELRTLPHITLFYPVNICFLFSVLCGCKAANRLKPQVITHLSIGTLVTIGLHYPIVGAVNYLTGQLAGQGASVCYQWYEALPLALLITALLYPVILFSKRYAPVLIGRKNIRYGT